MVLAQPGAGAGVNILKTQAQASLMSPRSWAKNGVNWLATPVPSTSKNLPSSKPNMTLPRPAGNKRRPTFKET